MSERQLREKRCIAASPFPPAFAAGRFSSCDRTRPVITQARAAGQRNWRRKSTASSSALVQTRQQILEVQRRVVRRHGRRGRQHLRRAPAGARRPHAASTRSSGSSASKRSTPSTPSTPSPSATSPRWPPSRTIICANAPTDMRDVDRARAQQSAGRQGRRRSAPPHRAVHPGQPRLTPVHHGATGQAKFVLGFATDIGSKTSHTAIMARSLRIPAVVGLQERQRGIGDRRLRAARRLTTASIIVNPTDQTLFEYGQLVRKQGHAAGKTARNSAQARRHPRRHSASASPPTSSKPHDAESVQGQRRGGRRPVPHGISCSSTATACPTRRSSTKSIARWPPR